MAYSYLLPDDSTLAKIRNASNSLSLSDADIARYLGMVRQQGLSGLQGAFGAAQANIGAQFTPAMRLAQARLGANPLLADSGYANRLNRQIQMAAFGDLSRAYGNAAAQESQTELGALQSLIGQQAAQRNAYAQAILGTGKKKKKFGDYLGSIVGTGLGALAGGYGTGGGGLSVPGMPGDISEFL